MGNRQWESILGMTNQEAYTAIPSSIIDRLGMERDGRLRELEGLKETEGQGKKVTQSVTGVV